MNDRKIFGMVYLAVLGIILSTVLSNLDAPIISDRYQEFVYYMHTVETGEFKFSGDSLVNSSIMVTYLPALLQRATSIDAILLFKVLPQFFFALTPAFAYLISRLYVNERYALLAAAFMVTNFYFLYYSEMGRVGVGFGLFAGVIWAVLTRRVAVASVFCFAIVFAHYGANFLLLALLIFTACVLMLKQRRYELNALMIPLLILAFTTVIWHFGIVESSWRVSQTAVEDTLDLSSERTNGVMQLPTPSGGVQKAPASETKKDINPILDVDKRDVVIQMALGKTLPYANTPQKIEFAVSWIIVLMLSASVVYSLIKGNISFTHKTMMVGVIIMFGLALFFPAASKLYGIARFYTTAVIVLIPCWALLARRIKPYYALSVMAVYASVLSGTLHSWFGIVK